VTAKTHKSSRSLIYATGNDNKFYEAANIAKKFDVKLVQKVVAIDEIQHHEAIEITKAKARDMWDVLKQPVVVTDHSWEIPALGGFPGGYMKDITSWLSTQDFLLLMSDKKDKRIYLKEIVAYCDGDTLEVFAHKRQGHFVDEPKGSSPPSFSRVVEMEGEGMTIAEVFDKGNWDTDFPDRYKSWYDFYEWYTNR